MLLSDIDSNCYRVIFKPNCSLTAKNKRRVVLLLTIIPCCVAIGFAMLGAWLVLPFMGLEIGALAYAFYYVNSHESDFESITIDENSMLIEFGRGQQVSKHELNPYWVSIQRLEFPNGELRLNLISHGKRLEIGRYLTRKQREMLANQLQKRTGTFKQQ